MRVKKTGSGLRFQPPHINAQNVTPVELNTAKIVYAFVMKVLFAKSLETSSLSQIFYKHSVYFETFNVTCFPEQTAKLQ